MTRGTRARAVRPKTPSVGTPRPDANCLGVIYVIAGGKDYYRVKIGFTSRSPEDRMRDLRTANPEKLRMLGKIRSVRMMEADIHRELRYAPGVRNVGGEWYEDCPELREELRRWGLHL